MKEELQSIRNAISKDQLPDAIYLFSELFTSGEIRNHLDILSMNLNAAKNNWIRGILDTKNFDIEKRKIIYAILELISDLERGLQNRKLSTSKKQSTSAEIYISYCKSDREFAHRLINDLRCQDVNVWIDDEQIGLGDSLIKRIEDGLDNVKFWAVILSPSAMISPMIQALIEAVLNLEINNGEVKLLPLLREHCNMPLLLRRKKYADFTNDIDYQNMVGLLLRSL